MPSVIRRRIVVCIDGTWVDPDGVAGSYKGNVSNTYRIFSVIKEGRVHDSEDKSVEWDQSRKYFPGIGVGVNILQHLASGALGVGCEEAIGDVYEYCCRHTTSPEDEVYLFGFSRGAYIARAVASLMHSIYAIKWHNHTAWVSQYKEGRRIYRILRNPGSRTDTQTGAINLFFAENTRPPPKIRFMGIIDTVKAQPFNQLHNINNLDSVQHVRHVLAFNETRTSFSLELWDEYQSTSLDLINARDGSHLEAWFLGNHGDLGGANTSDGLALYALQWLLSEAQKFGLILEFKRPPAPLDKMDDTLTIVFPEGDYPGPAVAMQEIHSSNGITTSMWNLERIHTKPRYQIELNSAGARGFWFAHKKRKAIREGRLRGYNESVPIGTFLHPSVFLLLDCVLNFNINREGLGLNESLLNYRPIIIPHPDQVFWKHHFTATSYIDKVRILVCGNNGSGKSTLINKVFGEVVTEVSEGEHGQHNVDQPLQTHSKPNLVVHDSCGFQAGLGEDNEVAKVLRFLKTCGAQVDIADQLHIIWLCKPAISKRFIETADIDLIKHISLYRIKAPVILVLTQKDEYYCIERAKVRRSGASEDSIDTIADSNLDEKVIKFKSALETISQGIKFAGAIAVSEDDGESINHLESMTRNALPHEAIRDLYISAQICNVDTKIRLAIQKASEFLKMGSIMAGMLPSALISSAIGYKICTTISQAFGYHKVNSQVVLTLMKDSIFHNKAATAFSIGQAGVYGLELLDIIGGYVIAGEAVLWSGPGIFIGAAIHATFSIPSTTRAMMIYIVDIVLIMERAFWNNGDGNNITDKDIAKAIADYAQVSDEIHNEICSHIHFYDLVKSFKVQGIVQEMERLIEKYRIPRS